MSALITTQLGEAVPPAPRHAITVHMPGWDTVERFADNPSAMIASFKSVYPRMKPHRDIDTLAQAVLKLAPGQDQACYLFSSLQSAQECVAYSISSRRDNGVDKTPIEPDKIQIRAFVAKNHFFAVLFPAEKRLVVSGFWATPGVGVSSRFAEANLEHLDKVREVKVEEVTTDETVFQGSAHQMIRQRVISLLQRAPIPHHAQPTLSADDVYLYPTGMASIYKPYTYITNHYEDTAVLYGMAFMNTISAFEEFGDSHKFFGLGTDQDLQALEDFLRQERTQGRKVSSIWAEFPANPILVTPDLEKLRELADEYDALFIIDDTLGSFANIDVVGYTDMLVTSLTKSFNGYADAIGGSAVINRSSRRYPELKALFDKLHIPELFVDDAKAIEVNSRDYLTRSAKLNSNAAAIMQYLTRCADDPASAVRCVYYPSVNPSGHHYKRFMRPVTPEFVPGYGCLMSIEFESMAATKAFYDALNVHKGPHLGAPFTLAFAYVVCAYKNRLDWAAQFGLKPTQIRISAGLEDTGTLVEDFRLAVEAANRAHQAQRHANLPLGS
ncbi:hypothetical protein HIM_07237 [Hirsutella minnesotensis 3608]|uniref:Cystathionine gamma-synthase n=1 Tax=Hirsutella minnesotensis 3608 TaxID=1043627 RepID=A0A0F7ZTN9_9HYPO|nr:hypothetical protein HIM_07237 [Hirsutella minnesotensis 3608]